MVEIKYVGLDNLPLDEMDTKRIESLVAKKAEELQRIVNNELELKVHMKVYSKSGEKHKYSAHIRATFPGGTIASDRQHDWDAMAAVRKGLTALKEQLTNRFRT